MTLFYGLLEYRSSSLSRSILPDCFTESFTDGPSLGLSRLELHVSLDLAAIPHLPCRKLGARRNSKFSKTRCRYS